MSKYRQSDHSNRIKAYFNSPQVTHDKTKEILFQLLSTTSELSDTLVYSLEEINKSVKKNKYLKLEHNLQQWLDNFLRSIQRFKKDSNNVIEDLRYVVTGSINSPRILKNLELISKNHSFKPESALSTKDLRRSFDDLLFILREKKSSLKSPGYKTTSKPLDIKAIKKGKIMDVYAHPRTHTPNKRGVKSRYTREAHTDYPGIRTAPEGNNRRHEEHTPRGIINMGGAQWNKSKVLPFRTREEVTGEHQAEKRRRAIHDDIKSLRLDGFKEVSHSPVFGRDSDRYARTYHPMKSPGKTVNRHKIVHTVNHYDKKYYPGRSRSPIARINRKHNVMRTEPGKLSEKDKMKIIKNNIFTDDKGRKSPFKHTPLDNGASYKKYYGVRSPYKKALHTPTKVLKYENPVFPDHQRGRVSRSPIIQRQPSHSPIISPRHRKQVHKSPLRTPTRNHSSRSPIAYRPSHSPIDYRYRPSTSPYQQHPSIQKSPAEQSLNKLKSCMIVKAETRNVNEGLELTPTGHIINSPDKIKYTYLENNQRHSEYVGGEYIEGEIKILNEENAIKSNKISNMPSKYLRVTKPHKGETYVIDGARKYQDGRKTPTRIYRGEKNVSPYTNVQKSRYSKLKVKQAKIDKEKGIGFNTDRSRKMSERNRTPKRENEFYGERIQIRGKDEVSVKKEDSRKSKTLKTPKRERNIFKEDVKWEKVEILSPEPKKKEIVKPVVKTEEKMEKVEILKSEPKNITPPVEENKSVKTVQKAQKKEKDMKIESEEEKKIEIIEEKNQTEKVEENEPEVVEEKVFTLASEKPDRKANTSVEKKINLNPSESGNLESSILNFNTSLEISMQSERNRNRSPKKMKKNKNEEISELPSKTEKNIEIKIKNKIMEKEKIIEEKKSEIEEVEPEMEEPQKTPISPSKAEASPSKSKKISNSENVPNLKINEPVSLNPNDESILSNQSNAKINFTKVKNKDLKKLDETLKDDPNENENAFPEKEVIAEKENKLAEESFVEADQSLGQVNSLPNDSFDVVKVKTVKKQGRNNKLFIMAGKGEKSAKSGKKSGKMKREADEEAGVESVEPFWISEIEKKKEEEDRKMKEEEDRKMKEEEDRKKKEEEDKKKKEEEDRKKKEEEDKKKKEEEDRKKKEEEDRKKKEEEDRKKKEEEDKKKEEKKKIIISSSEDEDDKPPAVEVFHRKPTQSKNPIIISSDEDEDPQKLPAFHAKKETPKEEETNSLYAQEENKDDSFLLTKTNEDKDSLYGSKDGNNSLYGNSDEENNENPIDDSLFEATNKKEGDSLLGSLEEENEKKPDSLYGESGLDNQTDLDDLYTDQNKDDSLINDKDSLDDLYADENDNKKEDSLYGDDLDTPKKEDSLYGDTPKKEDSLYGDTPKKDKKEDSLYGGSDKNSLYGDDDDLDLDKGNDSFAYDDDKSFDLANSDDGSYKPPSLNSDEAKEEMKKKEEEERLKREKEEEEKRKKEEKERIKREKEEEEKRKIEEAKRKAEEEKKKKEEEKKKQEELERLRKIKEIQEKRRKEEELKRKMQPDAEDLYFTHGRKVQSIPEVKRLYEPKIKELESVEEAQNAFKTFKNSFIKAEQSNAYRLDVGLGGMITFGGEYLSIVREEDNGDLTSIERDYDDKFPLITLKILNDGNILYVDPITHDMIKVDSKMNELGRIKGVAMPQSYRETATGFNKNRRSSSVDDDRYVLWHKGLNNLAIVDTETFTSQEIPNFWTNDGGWCFAMIAVADKSFKKICGYAFNAKQIPTIHIYDMNTGAFKSQHKTNLLEMPEVKSMESSINQDMVFIGGGQDDSNGIAKIAAITFEAESKLLTECEIGPESMNCVYSIRRLKEGNLLFAGGFGSVVVVFFKENKFITLNIVEDVLTDEICDLRFLDGNLYAISQADEDIAKINFKKYNFRIEATPLARAKVSLASKFDLHIRREYELEENAGSLCMSETGEILYFGVEGFLKAAPKDKEGKYQVKNLPSSHINFLGMREVGQSFIAYSDIDTNKFYVVDFGMNQIARIKALGIQTISKSLFPFRNYHSSSHDFNIFLWIAGDCKLGIIDMASQEYEIVDHLGGASPQDSLAHCAVSCDNGRRVCTLTTKQETDVTFINYWRKGASAVITKPVNSIDSSIEKIFCLEISNDATMLFAGGETREHNGVLLAVSFDKYFDYIAKEEFMGEPVGCLRKLLFSDVFLVGAGRTLSVVNYDDKHFSTLRTFSGIYSNQFVNDISVHKNEICLLGSKGDKVVHLTFKNNVGDFKVK